MKMNWIPTKTDIISIMLGASSAFILTGGLPSYEQTLDSAPVPVQGFELDNGNSVDSAKGYKQLLTAYADYYNPPESQADENAENRQNGDEADQVLEAETFNYFLQATFLGKKNLAVILVKNKTGALVDTKLVTVGESLSEYSIQTISRTQITLKAEGDPKPLTLKLFERKKVNN